MLSATRNLLYLINPIAGTKNNKNLAAFITKATTAKQLAHAITYTNKQGNYDYLKTEIETHNITDIIIVGGDGTVNQIVSAVGRLKVNIGILPFGSGNGLAFAAGIPKSIEKALQIIFAGKTQLTDAFMVNQQFACMLFGLGFDAQVAHNFAKQTKRGLLNYTKQSLLHYFKAMPYLFDITIDDFTFTTDAFFISIANSNQFGNQFTIAPKASLADGLLDIVLVQKMSKLKLPFALLNQIRGKNKLVSLIENLQHNNIVYVQSPSIIIKNKKLAPLHIDGEPIPTTEEISIDIMPQYFNLLVP